MFSVKGRVIIITGANGSIGREISLALANCGAYVYGIDAKLSHLILSHQTVSLSYRRCDITNAEGFKKICVKIYRKHGHIDVLINNAGVTYPVGEKKSYPKVKWEKTLQVNLTGAFLCSQVAAGYMKRNKKGSIINITSLNAERGFPDNPAYVASKGGLKMLGKALARDWGRHGIRVNNIGPGYFITSMTKNSYQNLKTRKFRESITMLGRWGETKDLIGPCIFLASDASSYITGQDLYVDGGWLANGLPQEGRLGWN